MRLLDWVLDLVYPPRCVFCHKFLERGEEPVCAHCRSHIPYTHKGGEQTGDFFSLCVSPLYYEDDVRESVLRYKFHETTGYAAVYGKLVAECITEHLEGRYDLISWVPLSPKRLKERGYDQAKLLARAVAKQLGTQAVSTLEKHKNVARQSSVGSPEKRRANISGAYRVPKPDVVAGQRVLLLDDIITSGSTLSECARTLRTAGAKEVLCATVARAAD